jgi:hypothetical protein
MDEDTAVLDDDDDDDAGWTEIDIGAFHGPSTSIKNFSVSSFWPPGHCKRLCRCPGAISQESKDGSDDPIMG